MTQAAATAAGPPLTLVPSPAHARLFAPPHADTACRFEVTPARIEDVATLFAGGSLAGSWKVETASILDVFDEAAMYDRSRLTRLYGGKSAHVARGPIIRNGAVVAAVLLLTPYPEPDLRHLNPGTLVMTVEVPQKGDR